MHWWFDVQLDKKILDGLYYIASLNIRMGRSQTTLTKFYPLLSTFLPLVEIAAVISVLT